MDVHVMTLFKKKCTFLVKSFYEFGSIVRIQRAYNVLSSMKKLRKKFVPFPNNCIDLRYLKKSKVRK